MTDEEHRNRATAHRYVELYNNDVERFVPACYTADCRALRRAPQAGSTGRRTGHGGGSR